MQVTLRQVEVYENLTELQASTFKYSFNLSYMFALGRLVYKKQNIQ